VYFFLGFDEGEGSRHDQYMAATVEKGKTRPSDIIADLAELNARQLELIIEYATALRAEKRGLAANDRESGLLRIINRGLPLPKTRRLEELQEKVRTEEISARERGELNKLTDEIETLAAERMKALRDLAAIRKVSVRRLLQELDLAAPFYG
jgi:hypothetical protein